MQRVFIIGNGGSGKSWLAKVLAERLQVPAVHLDDLHWLRGFAGEHPRAERDLLVAQAAERDAWIMEGIYGTILRQVFARVTDLIWLDMPDEECISNLRERGQTGGGTSDQFDELLDYTRGYRLRKNHLNSFEAHAQFFEAHPLQKARLRSRQEMAAFLSAV